MRPSARTALALCIVGSVVLTLTACSNTQPNREPQMTASSNPSGEAGPPSSAKAAWDDLNRKVESTQAMIGGKWEISDSGATACGSSDAQWAITRLGPGAGADDRARLIDQIVVAWKGNGWTPARGHIGGDAPGLQLRYPAGGSFDDGFFIELGMTDHGTSIQARTPCAPGDMDSLNKEQYAYNHQNTTRLPSDSPSAP